MLIIAGITLLCLVILAFYARFLAALLREYRPRWIRHWVRSRLGSGWNSELRKPRRPGNRAA